MSEETEASKNDDLKNQLQLARSEIKNLRSQIISLKFSFRKDCENIERQLVNGIDPPASQSLSPEPCNCEFAGWRSIGVVNTWFPGKRGVPRQAALSPEAQGTCGSHVKTKVAPPRLGGARVGLFSTRSPHRPCPIGLSLVKLDRIEENTVYFSGVDMVDGTPVLDIKPYIPQYDDPRCLLVRSENSPTIHDGPSRLQLHDGDECSSADTASDRLVEGEAGAESPVPTFGRLSISDDEMKMSATPRGTPLEETDATVAIADGAPSPSRSLRSQREAPDGEEEPEGPVQVASWITSHPAKPLQVCYDDRALAQLSSLPEHAALQATVTRLLEQDPRSNYLRRKLGSQFYTFRIDAFYVSVKFDDAAGVVTVNTLQQAV